MRLSLTEEEFRALNMALAGEQVAGFTMDRVYYAAATYQTDEWRNPITCEITRYEDYGASIDFYIG